MCASALLVICIPLHLIVVCVCVCVCVCVSALLLVFSALQRCVSSPSEVVCALAYSVICASTLQVVFASTLLIVVCSWGGGGACSIVIYSEGQTTVVLACLWGMHGVIQACMVRVPRVSRFEGTRWRQLTDSIWNSYGS